MGLEWVTASMLRSMFASNRFVSCITGVMLPAHPDSKCLRFMSSHASNIILC